MSVNQDPVEATSIAVFGAGDNPAAGISYNLPLPGSYSFQRIVPLDIPSGDFTSAAADAGTPLTALGAVQLGAEGGISGVDADRLLSYYNRSVSAGIRPSLRLAGTYGESVLNPMPLTDAAAAPGAPCAPSVSRAWSRPPASPTSTPTGSWTSSTAPGSPPAVNQIETTPTSSGRPTTARAARW